MPDTVVLLKKDNKYRVNRSESPMVITNSEHTAIIEKGKDECPRYNNLYGPEMKYKDGYLWFVYRDDDVIKSSGYRISPFEVESALLEYDAG